jgi:hypothetical protein
MVAGSGCVFRLENTLSVRYCPNEAEGGFGGYCAEHELENPNSPNRCVTRIEPGQPGNEAGTTDVRCTGRVLALVGAGRHCTAHQPA